MIPQLARTSGFRPRTSSPSGAAVSGITPGGKGLFVWEASATAVQRVHNIRVRAGAQHHRPMLARKMTVKDVGRHRLRSPIDPERILDDEQRRWGAAAQ